MRHVGKLPVALLASCFLLASQNQVLAGGKKEFLFKDGTTITRDDFGSRKDDRFVIKDKRGKKVGTIEKDDFRTDDRWVVKDTRGRKVGEATKEKYYQ